MRLIKKYKIDSLIIHFFLIIVFLVFPSQVTGNSGNLIKLESGITSSQATQQPQVNLYFFWGDGCPHCAKAKPFLQHLSEKYPQLIIIDFEVWHVPENQAIFEKVAAAYGMEPRAVPTIFLGDRYWEGYAEQLNSEIEAAVQKCIAVGCPDRGKEALSREAAMILPTSQPVFATQEEPSSQPTAILPERQPTSSLAAAVIFEPTHQPTHPVPVVPSSRSSIEIPFIGMIDLSYQSLFVSTLLISFVDGFNPCSIWVLSMLLSITLHTGSRKKIVIIGLVFLTVTALIYALFIAGLFTIFTFVSWVWWIQVLVALVALFFASVNIKDYFWYKEGLSFTIDDAKKPDIFRRIRRVMDAGDSFWGLVGGTIILAAGVSLVEFSCTAGFPVLWTNLVSAQQVTAVTFAILLLIYMIIYQLDELGIFLVAVFSLRASKLEEKHGRILKLVGGVLMLTLAGVMLIKPSLMNDLSNSMLIFGTAFAITILILLVHRMILPRIGIRIGSELAEPIEKNK